MVVTWIHWLPLASKTIFSVGSDERALHRIHRQPTTKRFWCLKVWKEISPSAHRPGLGQCPKLGAPRNVRLATLLVEGLAAHLPATKYPNSRALKGPLRAPVPK